MKRKKKVEKELDDLSQIISLMQVNIKDEEKKTKEKKEKEKEDPAKQGSNNKKKFYGNLFG
jgi:hypothetical protein